MKYSVYNKSMGCYHVYEGPPRPTRSFSGDQTSVSDNASAAASNLLTLDESAVVLPADSEFIGDSEAAVGTIAVKDYSPGRFFFFVAASMVAGVLSKWIYEEFFK